VALKQSATDSSLNSSCGPCHHQMRKRFDDSPHGSLITHSKSKRELMRNSQVGGGLPASVSSFEHNSDVFPENHDHSEANSPSTSLAPLRVVDGLGQGGFACVVQVESTEDKTSQFAMKVIPKHKATRRRDRARLKVQHCGSTHYFSKKNFAMLSSFACTLHLIRMNSCEVRCYRKGYAKGLPNKFYALALHGLSNQTGRTVRDDPHAAVTLLAALPFGV